jgi:hypothetical protein
MGLSGVGEQQHGKKETEGNKVSNCQISLANSKQFHYNQAKG